MHKIRITTIISGILLCCCALASARQADAPSARQIADALTAKPAAAAPPAATKPAPKTRNLSIEEAPAGEEARPASAPAGPPSINLAIQFDLNSDRVQPASVALLNSLAEALQSPQLLQARFLVEGHTDGTGQPAYNKRLSAQRAAQVKRVLVQRHVDAARIVTEGKGSSELLNPAEPGAAENRRVRIVMLGL